MNPEDVAAAMPGCDAVMVALNNQRTSDFPWAKPKSPTTLVASSVRNLAAVMQAAAVRRIVIVSALGTADSFDDAPWIIRFLIRNSNVGIAYADHDAVDAFIRTTDLDWTLVRAVGLSNAKGDKRLVVGDARTPKPAMMVSRANIARFMLDCVENNTQIGGTPVVSER